jgi:hypothetical protein
MTTTERKEFSVWYHMYKHLQPNVKWDKLRDIFGKETCDEYALWLQENSTDD